jgi:hypothetical protein
METTVTNPVGKWIEECRNVNSSWRCMIPSNIILYRLELSSIFDPSDGWYEEWYEEFNEDHETDYTAEEFAGLVLEYIKPELLSWTAETLAEIPVEGWLQTMDQYRTDWDDIRECLSFEGVPELRLVELDAELT